MNKYIKRIALTIFVLGMLLGFYLRNHTIHALILIIYGSITLVDEYKSKKLNELSLVISMVFIGLFALFF